MGEFRCRNSGKCCLLTHIEVGIGVGDLIRISEKEKIPIKQLLQDWVGLNPFSTDKEYVYEYELGIDMPCSFRQLGKCSVYDSRPLNCRMFPYWILANLPKHEIRRRIDSSYRCIHETVLTKERKERYKNYTDKIGSIILKEAELTDQMMAELGFKRIVNIRGATEDQERELRKTYKGVELQKKIDEVRIEFCKRNLNKQDYADLPEKVAAYIEKNNLRGQCARQEQIDRIEVVNRP